MSRTGTRPRPIDDPRHRSPDGSRPWVFACPKTLDPRFACYAVAGTIFSNQFQSRRFVGTGSDALPVSVHDPLMADFLDCIFCHCGPTTVRPPAGSALRQNCLTILLTDKRKRPLDDRGSFCCWIDAMADPCLRASCFIDRARVCACPNAFPSVTDRTRARRVGLELSSYRSEQT